MTGRLDVLHRILKLFADLDDLYVAERLYAVAYGVAMRSHDKEKMGNVAQWVYDNVFADGKPPAHILLRDYARGVVERALYLGSEINIDRRLIEPPYKSEFPDIPTSKEIEKYKADPNRGSYDSRQIEWAQHKIESSIFEFGDFGRKVIGTDSSSNWLSLRLNTSQHQYIEGDKPLLRFDLKQVQKYVFKRVFELGWKVEKFGQFDRFHTGYASITGANTERVGKKYQWIAYHEIMAYISDHFQYLDGYDKIGQYEGPWTELIRNIDPSVTLRSNKGGTSWKTHEPSWWAKETYNDWKKHETHRAWLRYENDVPAVEKLMSFSPSPKTGLLNLYGSFTWREPHPADVEASDVDCRELWFRFTGCFVHNDEIDTFVNWARKVDPNRNDILTPPKAYNEVFFGEYGWAPRI